MIWPALVGGRHCARDTVTEIAAAGVVVREHTPLDVGPAWALTNPHVLGIAVAR